MKKQQEIEREIQRQKEMEQDREEQRKRELEKKEQARKYDFNSLIDDFLISYIFLGILKSNVKLNGSLKSFRKWSKRDKRNKIVS